MLNNLLIDPARRRRAALWLTLLAGVLVGVGALWPMPDIPGPPGSDKTMHILAFFALVLPTATLSPRLLVWVLPLAVLYGGAIEIVQPYFGRERELLDLVADSVGAGLGSLAGLVLFRGIVSG